MLTAFLAYSMKAMARCSPLSKNAAANVANVENQDATGHPVETARIVSEGEAPGAPNNDGHALSARGTEDSMDGGASDDENSQTYYFGASTITLSKINKMVEMGYFVEGEARVTGRKRSRSLIMTKPLVMRTFSSLDYACLCILLWVASCYNCRQNFTSWRPLLLLKCQSSFWATGSFEGVPSSDTLAKWYELHYQLKRVKTPEGEMFTQYSYLNFHVKRDGGPKLSLALKNKWSWGWTKS
jgi:hypothetical protein